MSRSIDVNFRGEIVDFSKSGDKAIFTGILVVEPEIVQLLKPGEKSQSQAIDTKNMKRNGDVKALDGVTGLKKIGKKDLSFKMVFITSSVHSADSIFRFTNDL